jgi:hypothetical protein
MLAIVLLAVPGRRQLMGSRGCRFVLHRSWSRRNDVFVGRMRLGQIFGKAKTLDVAVKWSSACTFICRLKGK